MSDILEVVVTENPLEIVFNDQPLEVLVQEDNYLIDIAQDVTEIIITSEDIEVLTIAEQGPPGVGGGSGGLFDITVGNTPPTNPQPGQLWLDMN